MARLEHDLPPLREPDISTPEEVSEIEVGIQIPAEEVKTLELKGYPPFKNEPERERFIEFEYKRKVKHSQELSTEYRVTIAQLNGELKKVTDNPEFDAKVKTALTAKRDLIALKLMDVRGPALLNHEIIELEHELATAEPEQQARLKSEIKAKQQQVIDFVFPVELALPTEILETRSIALRAGARHEVGHSRAIGFGQLRGYFSEEFDSDVENQNFISLAVEHDNLADIQSIEAELAARANKKTTLKKREPEATATNVTWADLHDDELPVAVEISESVPGEPVIHDADATNLGETTKLSPLQQAELKLKGLKDEKLQMQNELAELQFFGDKGQGLENRRMAWLKTYLKTADQKIMAAEEKIISLKKRVLKDVNTIDGKRVQIKPLDPVARKKFESAETDFNPATPPPSPVAQSNSSNNNVVDMPNKPKSGLRRLIDTVANRLRPKKAA